MDFSGSVRPKANQLISQANKLSGSYMQLHPPDDSLSLTNREVLGGAAGFGGVMGGNLFLAYYLTVKQSLLFHINKIY